MVRTAQSLGYTGYQQLRVLLARDSGPPPVPGAVPGSPGARVASTFAHVAASVPAMVALLDHADVERAVEALALASRIVIIGNGLSAPLAVDASARLISIGRRAEAPSDVIGQQVSARQLGAGEVLLVISGSGASSTSARADTAARQGGATVVLSRPSPGPH